MAKYFVENDISTAKTIHSDFYSDPKVFESSKEKIFAEGLHFVGDISLLPERGSAFPFTLLEGFLDEPVVIIRDKDNLIKCLSNVCTHRGNLLITEPCKLCLGKWKKYS